MQLSNRTIDPGIKLLELREPTLVAANVTAFKESFVSMTGQATQVVLDLSGVRFIDSSGMGALISCLKGMHSRGGALRISGLSAPVRALFELMRMHTVFPLHATADEAVRAFG